MLAGTDFTRQGSGHAANGRATEISGRWRRDHSPGILRTRRVPPHRAGELPGNDSASFRDLTSLKRCATRTEAQCRVCLQASGCRCHRHILPLFSKGASVERHREGFGLAPPLGQTLCHSRRQCNEKCCEQTQLECRDRRKRNTD
jgi:hypothetical protein